MMVAIEMITYNHAPFIRTAIESVLDQKTDFEYCLYIFDDSSRDGTQDICREYAVRFPHKIKFHTNEVNVGVIKNARMMHTATCASGAKYIAICEGDDYWCNPLKLQQQVDFLENNSDYAVCFHRVYELADNTLTLSNALTSGEDGDFSLQDLATANYIPTISVLYRNQHAEILEDWFENSPIGDYPLHLINGKYGKYRYFTEPMAVYRRHAGGIYSASTQKNKYLAIIRTVKVILYKFDKAICEILLKQLEGYFSILIADAYISGNRQDALALTQEAAAISPEMKDLIVLNVFPSVVEQILQTRKYKVGSQLSDIGKRFGLFSK
jgi:glycosyltransferase involved in cell wall biosynthesis